MRYAIGCIVCAVIIAFGGSQFTAEQRREGGTKVHGPKTTVKSVPGTRKAEPADGRRVATAVRAERASERTPENPDKLVGPAAVRVDPDGAPVERASVTTPAMTPTASLEKNTLLVDRVRPLLPPGTDIAAAAAGFKNQGQFVAAVYAADNLGIPFTDLRSRMVDNGLSLGQAIQSLRPGTDYDAEATRALRQANAEINAAVRDAQRDTR